MLRITSMHITLFTVCIVTTTAVRIVNAVGGGGGIASATIKFINFIQKDL